MSDPVSLRDFLMQIIDGNDRRYEARFAEQKEAIKAALDSAALAVNKAETATEKRFDSVNEFRAQAQDRDAAYLTKAEFEGFRTAQSAQARWLAGFAVSGVIGVVGLLLRGGA